MNLNNCNLAMVTLIKGADFPVCPSLTGRTESWLDLYSGNRLVLPFGIWFHPFFHFIFWMLSSNICQVCLSTNVWQKYASFWTKRFWFRTHKVFDLLFSVATVDVLLRLLVLIVLLSRSSDNLLLYSFSTCCFKPTTCSSHEGWLSWQ